MEYLHLILHSERGVRQGDPLSAYCVHYRFRNLSIALRTNEYIEGITILGKSIKLAQYADDMNNFLSTEKSAHALFGLLKKFELLSGLKVNKSKTEGKWLGSLKTPSRTFFRK